MGPYYSGASITQVEPMEQPMEVPEPPMAREYIPSADELRERHEIRIQFLSYGCVVHVGCKSIAFTDYVTAIDQIKAYAKDPITAYKNWGDLLNVKL
jgi:hypothetical protein